MFSAYGGSMQRRELITLLGGAVAASGVSWPLAARAQQPAMPVVGVLDLNSAAASARSVAAFREGLKETGYVEDRNVAIEYRWAESQYDRLPALAIELVSRRVSVIFAMGNAAAQMVKPASSNIPIVFSVGGDPVTLGLVASLNRPGGNITGVSFITTAIVAKMLEVLHEAVPRAAVFAALVNPANPNSVSDIREAQDAARILGLQLLVLNASTEREIDVAFATLIERRAGALVTAGDALFGSKQLGQLAALSTRHAMPAIYHDRDFAVAGGLMSYGAGFSDTYRISGTYVGRILKGDKPADLPVQQSTKVELIINMKTAKTLGITFPITLLGRADAVIE
jgi:putative tryptophan/tyrosine transport system substrate-binding protein